MPDYPRLLPVRQKLYSRAIEDVPDAVREAMRAAVPHGRIQKGQRIGITAGSRGINNIGLILKSAVEEVRARGGEPFIFPSMGSHGGATDRGQAELLDQVFDISEKTVGCPVLSTMDVVELGRTPEHDIPVYIDKHQAKADGLIVVAREKAHTDFHGPYESGLCKMMCIGMGKRAQAESVHAYGAWGLKHLIPEVAKAKLQMAPILGGLAILEDGHDRTSEIHGLPADRIMDEEPALLEKAKEYQAKLPFDALDLLVVDRISKEISGTCMDTTVIGRVRIHGAPESEWTPPDIQFIIARAMDEHASDNGIGIGLADIVTRRLHDAVDLKKTQVNGLTATFSQRLMLPVVADDDRQAMDHAMYLLRRKKPFEVTMVRIRDTARLEKFYISEALLEQAKRDDRIEILGEPEEIRFGHQGRMVPDQVMEAPTVQEWSGLHPGTDRKAA